MLAINVAMFKWFTTILLLLLLAGNTLAAMPPHPAGTGGCETECCETAHQTGPAATIAGVCCMLECPLSAELLPVSTTSPAPPPVPGLLPTLQAISFVASIPSQTNFPSAPTRHLHGSSSRYLDCCSFLL